jgi:hypothetical protein
MGPILVVSEPSHFKNFKILKKFQNDKMFKKFKKFQFS